MARVSSRTTTKGFHCIKTLYNIKQYGTLSKHNGNKID